MARPIWKGVITFGMVSIPVKLYAATDSKDFAMHLLHKKCNSRLKQMRWCPSCEREVEWSEVARGYEHVKDQYVVLTEEDLEKLPLPSRHTIQVSSFVESSEIDPVFFEKSYYLEPEDTGLKPYALLIRALTEKGRVAVGKIALRDRERLCSLRPMDGNLVLETLFYADEVRVSKGTAVPAVEVSDGEMTMAGTLVDLMSEPFDPEKHHDQYRSALTEIIEAKLRGEEVVEVMTTPAARVIDLMEALKASVDEAKKRKRAVPSERESARQKPAA